MEVPEEVLTDQVFVGKITVKNTGSAPWKSIPYAGEPNPQPILYSQDPDRNKTWGTDFAYVGQGKEIGPGKEFTFVSGFKAPSVPGEYGFQWRLARRAKDGDTVFFGEPTIRKVIRVRPRPETPRPARPPATRRARRCSDSTISSTSARSGFRRESGKAGRAIRKSASRCGRCRTAPSVC